MHKITHSFAVVLTQGCDLEQDFKARNGQNKLDKLLPDVLCCQMDTAKQLRGTVVNSEIWKRISQNKDERYHFLQKVELLCDADREGLGGQPDNEGP